MARGYLKDIEYRKTDISTYIIKLMRREHQTQTSIARRMNKTQSWMSKKLSNCDFEIDELLEIFKALNAESEEVGKLFTFRKE